MIRTKYNKNILTLGDNNFGISLDSNIHRSDINFPAKQFNTQWPITLSVDYSVLNNPIRLTSPPGTTSQLRSECSTSFEPGQFFHFEFGCHYSTPTPSPFLKIVYEMFISDSFLAPTTNIIVRFLVGPTTNRVTFGVFSSFGALNQQIDISTHSPKFVLTYAPFNGENVVYLNVEDGPLWKSVGDGVPWGPDSMSPTTRFFNTISEPDVVQSVTRLRPYNFYPVVTKPLSLRPMPYPLPISFTDKQTNYRIDAAQIGTLNGIIYGVGSNFGNAEEYEITVIDQITSETNVKFLVTRNDKFYTDDIDDITCPDFSFENEDESNVGNLSGLSECFCDGSLEDRSITKVVTSKNGSTRRDSSFNSYPEVLFEREDGVKFGENTDFRRIHIANEDLNLSSQFRFLRCLPLKDGRRFYYGALVDDFDDNQDVYIKWESSTLDSDSSPADLFCWVQHESDTTQINPKSYLGGSYNIATDSNLRYNLPPGRYYFHFNKAMGFAFGDINRKVEVYLGTDDTGRKIAEWPADRKVDPFLPLEIKFEVREVRGRLFCAIHDPCEGTFDFIEGSNDINLKTDSLSAVELNDGRVVVVYDKIDTNSPWDSKSNNLYYRVVNFDPISISFDAIINLPIVDTKAQQFVHCFDMYSDDEDIYLVVGFHQTRGPDDISGPGFYRSSFPLIDYRGRPRTFQIFWEPFVQGSLFVLKLERGIYEWDANDVNFTMKDSQTFQLKSLQTMVRALEIYRGNVDAADTAVFGNYQGAPFAAPARIRINYNRDHKSAVCSIIDDRLRQGDIFVIDKGFARELCYPLVFNQMSKIIVDQPGFEYWQKIESLTADWSSDGFIYGVASTRDIDYYGTNEFDAPHIEYFQCDPKFLTYPQDSYLEYVRGYSFIRWQNVKIPDGLFNQSPTPILQVYSSIYPQEFYGYDYSIPGNVFAGERPSKILSIPHIVEYRNDKNYNVLTLSGLRVSNPLIMQNGELDAFSFATFSEDTYFPELYTTTDWVHTVGTIDESFRTLIDSNGTSTISRSLNLSIPRGKVTKGQVGYKAYARVQTQKASPIDYTHPVYFTTRLVSGTFSNSLLASPTTFAELSARMAIYGLTILCQVFNRNTSLWDTVAQFDLPEHGIYDYYIVSRSTGLQSSGSSNDRGQILFVVKQPNHTKDLLDNGNHSYYLFNVDEVYLNKQSNVALRFSGVTETGLIRVGFEGATPGEVAYIHQIGWNVLNADQGIARNFIDVKNSNSFINHEYLYRNPKRFKPLNDSSLLTSEGSPQDGFPQDPLHGFKVNPIKSTGKTSRIHYQNGFNISIIGSISSKNDKFFVQRNLVNNPSNVSSRYTNGFWGSQEDDKEVYIWADAHDVFKPIDGVSKFSVDTFVISGANFREFYIVGRDSELSPWIELAHIQTDRLICDDYTAEYNGSTYVINAAGFSLGYDRFCFNRHYINMINEDSGNDRPRLVVNTDSDQIIVTDNESAAMSQGFFTIFSSDYNHKFDTLQQYRFFGIRIPSQRTYEGYYQIHGMDFGKAIDIPCFESPKRELSYNMTTNSLIVLDEQVYNKNYKIPVKTYEFSYDLASAISAKRIDSMIRQVAVESRAIWVIPNYEGDQFSHSLCLIDGQPSSAVLIDEEGDEFYEVEVTLRSVE